MITAFYAGLLAFLYFRISLDTIQARRRYKISTGPGKNNEIAEIVSAHSNFSAYVPTLLILTYLVEHSKMLSIYFIHFIATTYTVGRVLHYFAFRGEKMNFKRRVLGMQLTLWPLIILGTCCFYVYFASVFKH